MTGIRTSISTSSGHSLRQSSKASRPFVAAPITSRSGSSSNMAWIPSLISTWSSVIIIRAGEVSPCMSGVSSIGRRQRHLSNHGGALPYSAAELEVAAEQRDPFPHAGEADPLARTTVPRYRRRIEPAPEVPDLEVDLLTPTLQRDAYPGGPRVLARVPQGLPRDPVECRLDLRWQTFLPES